MVGEQEFGQPGRSRIRWEVPLCRLVRQPIPNSAASACLALVDGQSETSFLGRNERHVHGAGDCFAVLQAVGEEPQRERLHGRGRLLLCPAVCSNAGKGRDVR